MTQPDNIQGDWVSGDSPSGDNVLGDKHVHQYVSNQNQPQINSDNRCPFVAGPQITDPRLFVGRKYELDTLASRMRGMQPVSVNVTGEQSIGKSSLLYHFFQTWEQRVKDPTRFVVIYLSLQDVDLRTQDDFYRELASALRERPLVQQREPLRLALEQTPFTRIQFIAAMERFATEDVRPVFCVDAFEILFKRRHIFDNAFYDHVRELMNKNRLMFILASRHPIDVYAEKNYFSSDFFNVGHVLTLPLFTEEEATELTCLQVQGVGTALGIAEQRLAKEWGRGHPYLLQLAATVLCDAQQSGHDEQWAKAEFEAQQKRLQRHGRWQRKGRWLVWAIFLAFPRWLGSVPLRLGRVADDTANWVTGMVIILLIIGLFFWNEPVATLIKAVLTALGLGEG